MHCSKGAILQPRELGCHARFGTVHARRKGVEAQLLFAHQTLLHQYACDLLRKRKGELRIQPDVRIDHAIGAWGQLEQRQQRRVTSWTRQARKQCLQGVFERRIDPEHLPRITQQSHLRRAQGEVMCRCAILQQLSGIDLITGDRHHDQVQRTDAADDQWLPGRHRVRDAACDKAREHRHHEKGAHGKSGEHARLRAKSYNITSRTTCRDRGCRPFDDRVHSQQSDVPHRLDDTTTPGTLPSPHRRCAMSASSRLLEAHAVDWSVGEEAILSKVSLTLEEGEILTIIGPNGAGKTSLLRILMGLVTPSGGRVWRRPGLRIGYMPQRLAIDPSLPLRVRRFLRLAEHGGPMTLAAVAAEVGIEGLLDTPLAAVSGGEFQRVLLARALLREPQLLVLDEPAQRVDVKGQAELYRLIDSVRKRHGSAVLMISHDLHLVMAATDTVLCLNRHVCCAGKPEVVGAHPEFLHLFGRHAVQGLALYAHHHDHDHDIHGRVVDHGHG